MKTPAEVVKENFWVGCKGGLLDNKHYLKMRESVWLFLYLLRAQTALTPSGEGQVNHGHPLRLADIVADLKGIPERTVRRWIVRLKREGYIRIEHHSNHGITFWIAKGKDKTRKVKITHAEAASMMLARRQHAENSRPQMAECSENSRPDMAASSTNSRPHFVMESGQAPENTSLAPPIPKGFTPNSLSYYKHTSGAQDAPSPPVSLKEAARKLQPPGQPGRADLDERRRELLLQAEEIKRKYPSKSSPGKVVEMQPQEATA